MKWNIYNESRKSEPYVLYSVVILTYFFGNKTLKTYLCETLSMWWWFPMKMLIYVLFLALVASSFEVVHARTIFNAGNPDAKRLYDDLLSNYNKLVRPVVNTTDPLTVRIKLKLSQLIDVNLKNQIMTTNLWVEQVSHMNPFFSILRGRVCQFNKNKCIFLMKLWHISNWYIL